MTHEELRTLLQTEMVPALGCTGPTAYALATACCRPYLTAAPTQIDIHVSPAFLKIGFGVATPGTTRPGIEIAAAIGLIAGDHTLGMQVLKPATPEDMEQADRLADQGIIHILCAEGKAGVYVRAEVSTPREQVVAVVEHTHDGISLIEVNGVPVFQQTLTAAQAAEEGPVSLRLEEIFDYVHQEDPAQLRFLLDGYRMNLALAEDGLKSGFGLASGRAYLRQYWTGRSIPADLFEHPMDYLPDTLPERSRVLVAAASDGRMGGSRLPAMAAMGDGNQGLTATIPVGVAAELMQASEEEACRALALSCLMLFYVKLRIGRAAAFCLCAIAAAAGAAAGVGYLKGLSAQQLKAAVKNVISPLAGMLCDGAKNGCALKMAIASSSALSAVDLAAAGVEMGYYDGVCDDTLEDTVACISGIATRSMEALDGYMVDEIVKKASRRSAATRPVD